MRTILLTEEKNLKNEFPGFWNGLPNLIRALIVHAWQDVATEIC